MRRAVILGLLVLAWSIGPVIRIGDPAVPPPTIDAPRGAHP